jgi:hypothetical protein
MGRHSDAGSGRNQLPPQAIEHEVTTIDSGPSGGNDPTSGALFGDPTLNLYGGLG